MRAERADYPETSIRTGSMRLRPSSLARKRLRSASEMSRSAVGRSSLPSSASEPNPIETVVLTMLTEH